MPRIAYQYHGPDTIQEAVALLKEKGAGTHVMAGGTDLLVKIQHRVLSPKHIIGLKKVKGLDEIKVDDKKGLTIGATALLADVAAHPDILAGYPGIAQAAQDTANVQVRNMGTVVGNICNASPSADNVPTLLVMGAHVTIVGPDGERQLPLDQFFKGPGMTALEAGELVTAVHVPPPPKGSGAAYFSLSQRGKLDCSAVGVSAMVLLSGNTCKQARIAIGACAPVPMRAVEAEKLLTGKTLDHALIEEAAVCASKETRPISDVRASAAYRWKMVAVLTMRALFDAQKIAKK